MSTDAVRDWRGYVLTGLTSVLITCLLGWATVVKGTVTEVELQEKLAIRDQQFAEQKESVRQLTLFVNEQRVLNAQVAAFNSNVMSRVEAYSKQWEQTLEKLPNAVADAVRRDSRLVVEP